VATVVLIAFAARSDVDNGLYSAVQFHARKTLHAAFADHAIAVTPDQEEVAGGTFP
jgi:hypothetical protein